VLRGFGVLAQSTRSAGSKSARKGSRDVSKEQSLSVDEAFRIEEFQKRMDDTLASLKRDLATLRTGRAMSGILDNVIVEIKGSQSPLVNLGQVTMRDSQQLLVHVYDQTMVSSVDRAIRSSGLNLNPIVDGTLLRVPIPKPSKEMRDSLSKLAVSYAEQAKVNIRRVRQDGMQALRKCEKGSSKDEIGKQEKKLQVLTDDCIKKASDAVSAKEKEINSS